MCLYRTSAEAWEWANLAPYAAKSTDLKLSWRYTSDNEQDDIKCRFSILGNLNSQDNIDSTGAKSRYKTSFQIDKERIMDSQAFRRLEYKTQIFLSHEGDHFRTRLTHSLEVAAIAVSVANALKLNEDLSEAIALAHDLGHPPFGHGGEDVLSSLFEEYYDSNYSKFGYTFAGKFFHNVQGVRIVDLLELGYGWDMRKPGDKISHIDDTDNKSVRKYFSIGLDLTFAVREGILKHDRVWSGSKDIDQMYDSVYLLKELEPTEAGSLECQLVERADKIAFITHDLEDGVRSSLIEKAVLTGFIKNNIIRKNIPKLLGLSEEFDHNTNNVQEQGERQERINKFMAVYDRIVKHADKEEIKGEEISLGNILSFIKGLLLSNLIENSFYQISTLLHTHDFENSANHNTISDKKYQITIYIKRETTNQLQPIKMLLKKYDANLDLIEEFETDRYSIRWVHKSVDPRQCQEVFVSYMHDGVRFDEKLSIDNFLIIFSLERGGKVSQNIIDFSGEINGFTRNIYNELIVKYIHYNSRVAKLSEKGKFFMISVFKQYYNNPLQMYKKALERGNFFEDLLKVGVDRVKSREEFKLRLVEHIQGMTDRFITNEYSRLFLPHTDVEERTEKTINE